MHDALKEAFENEMREASVRLSAGDDAAAFRHYERAHVLGQMFVGPHVRAHLGMLRIGYRRRDVREIVGQLVRLPGAVVGSAIGRVPVGNTGGANVSAFAPMEIPEDLRRALAPPSGR